MDSETERDRARSHVGAFHANFYASVFVFESDIQLLLLFDLRISSLLICF